MRWVVLAPLVLLAGCSLAPGVGRPAAPVPASWPVGDAYLKQAEAGLPVVTHTEIFTDPRLQSVIEQALANNRDLRVAAANLAAARAQVRVVRAGQFPEVGVSGGATRSDTSGAAATTRYSMEAGVSGFELDLFGRLASATQAERETALATEAAARTVRLALVADIATAWISHAANTERRALAIQTADNARASVRLTRARLTGGIAPRTDVRQAEQVLATAEGDIAELTAALAQDRNRLDLLVGAPVDPGLLPGDLGTASSSIRTLPAGLSSDVLLRRPDVVEAEYRLRAANADMGVARAALFPRISLTGLAGLASDALASLFTGGALGTTLGLEVRQSLFSGGGAKAGVQVAEAQRDAAVAGYERAVQAAFRDVADALADQGTLMERTRASSALVAATADTARLTEARYRGGVDSYLDSLDAQRSLYAARQADITVRQANTLNRITLYRVLGGDQATPAPAAAR